MNGAIFGPVKGTIVDTVGLVLAAMLGYWINRHATRVCSTSHDYLERLPSWVKRFPVGSPAFLLAVRVIPGLRRNGCDGDGRRVARSGLGSRVDDVRDRDSDLHAADDFRRSRDALRSRLRTRARHYAITARRIAARTSISGGTERPSPHRRERAADRRRPEPRSKRLCARVADAARVALDTEFHAERTYSPRLMVVQLAFDDGAAIVDALALPRSASARRRVDAHDGRRARALRRPEDLRRPLRPGAAARLRHAGCGRVSRLRHAGLAGRPGARRSAACVWRNRRPSAIGRRVRSPSGRSTIWSTTSRISCRSTTRCARGSRRRAATSGLYEECAELGDIERYRIDERRAYLRIPGAMRMNRRELGILSELVKLRDRIARERDLPVRVRSSRRRRRGARGAASPQQRGRSRPAAAARRAA